MPSRTLSVIKQIYKAAIVTLAFMQLIEIITKVDLTAAIFIAAVIIGFLGVTFLGKGFKVVTIVFFVIGLILLIWYRQPLTIWMSSFNYMTNLISILVVMQLFTIPIGAGKYDLAIRHLLKRICDKESKLYIFTMLITHVFSSFLSMGTVPIVITLMEDTIKNRVSDYKRFMATSVSRAFTLGTLWAPGAATIFLVGQVTGVGWSKIFFPSLFLALVGLTVSYALELKQHHVSTAAVSVDMDLKADDTAEQKEEKCQHKVLHIAIAVISLIALTMLFIQLKIGSSASAVILSGVLISVLWTLLFRKDSQLIKTGIKNYWDSAMLKSADLAPFFVAIGVFSGSFEHSGIDQFLEQSMQKYADSLGIIAIILVPLIIVALALIGLHPLVSIAVFGQMLMTLRLPLPALTIALCLNLGGSIAYMVSPFAGIIMTLAKFIEVKPTDVAVRWNWQFCLIYFVLGISTAYCIGKIFASI
jgi:hypothetical protein